MSKNHSLLFLLAASGLVASLGAVPVMVAAHLAPLTRDGGGIRMTVTPQGRSGAFTVVLDTHNEALNDDLVAASQLTVDGQPSPARTWEGDPAGGHHRKGTLTFGPIPAGARAVELRTRLAGDGAPRIFAWRME